MQLWLNHFTSLCLSFHICMKDVRMSHPFILVSQIFWDIWVGHAKCYDNYHASVIRLWTEWLCASGWRRKLIERPASDQKKNMIYSKGATHLWFDQPNHKWNNSKDAVIRSLGEVNTDRPLKSLDLNLGYCTVLYQMQQSLLFIIHRRIIKSCTFILRKHNN